MKHFLKALLLVFLFVIIALNSCCARRNIIKEPVVLTNADGSTSLALDSSGDVLIRQMKLSDKTLNNKMLLERGDGKPEPTPSLKDSCDAEKSAESEYRFCVFGWTVAYMSGENARNFGKRPQSNAEASALLTQSENNASARKHEAWLRFAGVAVAVGAPLYFAANSSAGIEIGSVQMTNNGKSGPRVNSEGGAGGAGGEAAAGGAGAPSGSNTGAGTQSGGNMVFNIQGLSFLNDGSGSPQLATGQAITDPASSGGPIGTDTGTNEAGITGF